MLISTLEPILNPIWVFLVNGELPGPMALLGGAIVLLAALVRGLAMNAGSRRLQMSVSPNWQVSAYRQNLDRGSNVWQTKKAKSWS